MNLYAYTGNDPMNYKDPSGMIARFSYCEPGTTYIGTALDNALMCELNGVATDLYHLGEPFYEYFNRDLFDCLRGGCIDQRAASWGMFKRSGEAFIREMQKTAQAAIDRAKELGNRMLSCTIFEVESSVGGQAKFKLDAQLLKTEYVKAEIGVDLGTLRIRQSGIGSTGLSVVATQSVTLDLTLDVNKLSGGRYSENYNINLGGKYGREGSFRGDDSHLFNQQFQFMEETFSGITFGVAAIFGGELKLGVSDRCLR